MQTTQQLRNTSSTVEERAALMHVMNVSWLNPVTWDSAGQSGLGLAKSHPTNFNRVLENRELL